jgi:hypothetical protein
MAFLLEGKCHARDPVIEKDGSDQEGLLVKQHSVMERFGPDPLRGKSVPAVEFRHHSLPVWMRLGGDNSEIGRVVLYQVPGIGGEPVPYLVHKSGRAIEVERLVAAKTDPDKLVETDEMIQMGMGNEDVAHPEKLPRRETGQIPHVEEYAPPFEEKIDIETRVAKRAVDEGGMEKWFHDISFPLIVPLTSGNASLCKMIG